MAIEKLSVRLTEETMEVLRDFPEYPVTTLAGYLVSEAAEMIRGRLPALLSEFTDDEKAVIIYAYKHGWYGSDDFYQIVVRCMTAGRDGDNILPTQELKNQMMKKLDNVDLCEGSRLALALWGRGYWVGSSLKTIEGYINKQR
ncbi:MAG: hypothetical protein EOM01_08485 [Spirochaetia bacterium]|nr:hypothetical protein [Spirochaetia bacterium]